MSMRATVPGLALAVLLSAGGASAGAPVSIVVCAPGYPSNTEEAQPTMDAFAAGVAAAAGWKAGRLTAVYHPTVDGGLASLADERTALAVVPLPFYLEFGRRLELRPLLEVVQSGGPEEVWSLVARKGALPDAAALAGWKIAGLPGYAPEFVRDVALAGWGPLPEGVEVDSTGRVLSVLRRAAAGENVAALLDRAQTEALDSLPFAGDLEVVARSRPLLGTLLCRVGERIGDEDARQLVAAFLQLDDLAADRTLLETLRIERFDELPAEPLAQLERAYRPSADAGP